LAASNTSDQAQIARAVRAWLARSENWLLIFDNADDPGLLRPYLPQTHGGHILLTSRAYVFQDIGILRPVRISEMSPDDAVTFLLWRTERESGEIAERPAVRTFADELGRLPLALEQAAVHDLWQGRRFQDWLA